MTRPFDLYFKNHENQVWSRTVNEPYAKTCRTAGTHWFGATNGETLGGYLQDWWEDAPSFGRVTKNHFFYRDQGIETAEQEIRQCRERIKTLTAADLSTMSREQQARLAYFRELEKLIICFSENQELAIRPASKAIKAGKYDKARSLLQRADPAETIANSHVSHRSTAATGEKKRSCSRLARAGCPTTYPPAKRPDSMTCVSITGRHVPRHSPKVRVPIRSMSMRRAGIGPSAESRKQRCLRRPITMIYP
jgi:hypothetical protein